MKAYLIHKRGYTERFGQIIANLYNASSLSRVEIVFAEASSLVFPETDEHLIHQWMRKYIKSEVPLFGRITAPEQSLFHKHYFAFSDIAKSGEPGLVFEDDAQFNPADLDRFISQISQIPPGWDFVYFGTGCGLRASGNGFIRRTEDLKGKCTDSMLVSPEAASRIVRDWNKGSVFLPVDWDLNVRLNKFEMNVYWFEPAFVVQGSQTGRFSSEIRSSR
jgi:hypothetical protein